MSVHRIGAGTRTIDAGGRTLIPGLIDGHTHANFIYSISELIRYALPDGTTGVITEAIDFAVNLAYAGLVEFLDSMKTQPMKFYLTLPAWTVNSPLAKEIAISIGELRRLLRRREVIGLGEVYWGAATEGDEQVLDFISAALDAGKAPPLVCPDSGKPYVYEANGLQIAGQSGRLMLYEPTASRPGMRWGVLVGDPEPGKPLIVRVVLLPENAILAAGRKPPP